MINQKNRREFLKESIILASGIGLTTISSAFLNSCESFVEKNETPLGLNILIDLNTEVYPLLPIVAKLRGYVGFGVIKYLGKANYGIPVIIVKTDIDTWKCYSSLCTHMSCFGNENFHDPDPEKRNSSVRPPIGDNTIVCQCHGSRFDAKNDAKPIQGPAERSLKQYPCEFNKLSNSLLIHF